jgi:hypothetical protein
MTLSPAEPSACDFCGGVSADPCKFHRTDATKFGEVGTLCRKCVETFMCEMAYTDRKDFERMVEQARSELDSE